MVTILCEWAVTGNRSGEHRAFVAAKLLDQRQTDILNPDGDDEEGKEEDFFGVGSSNSSSTPVFQAVLWIRIRIGSLFWSFVNPDPYSEYESGSTHVNIG